MINFADILYVGMNVGCTKWFWEPLEESKAPLQKGHSTNQRSHLYASECLWHVCGWNFTCEALIILQLLLPTNPYKQVTNLSNS